MLSPTEFRKAIYLDFEGEGKKRDGSLPRPHMAGIFRPSETGGGGKHNSVFFNQQWNPASNGTQSSECLSFQDYFETLLSELEEKNCYLVYWTIHESTILKKYLEPKTYERLAPRLLNLHPLAKKFANKRRLFGENSNSRRQPLEAFWTVIYPERPAQATITMGAAELCRRIDSACRAHITAAHFTERQTSYIKSLIAYNKGDLSSTWLIAKRISNWSERTSSLNRTIA